MRSIIVEFVVYCCAEFEVYFDILWKLNFSLPVQFYTMSQLFPALQESILRYKFERWIQAPIFRMNEVPGSVTGNGSF